MKPAACERYTRRYNMIKLSSLTSRLQVAVLLHVLCLVATSLARDQRNCHQPTEFTIFDPNNPEGPVTCKTCPSCPAGQGLPVQCGSRVAIGTPTDCVPCKPNETFSESDNLSHCKSCTICEKKVVLQQCTPKQNRKCGGCPQGHYLDHFDECKECHYCCNNVSEQDHLHVQQCKDLGLPRRQWCKATDKNKLCKMQALLGNVTTVSPTDTVTTPLEKMDSTTTVSVVEPTGGNSATQNSTAEPSKLKPTPMNNTQIIVNLPGADADQGLIGRKSQQSQHDHFNEKHTIIFVIIGCIGAGALLILIIFLVVKLRRSMCKNRTYNYDSVEQGERLPLTELQRTNDLVINNQPNANGRESPSSENQSTTSSSNASTESIHSVQNEAPIHEDTLVNLDVQRIPEERIVSDMEWLRDDKGNLMLFFVQKQLDPVETAQNKTWRSVGLALGVSSETLNLIDTSYKAEKSPTEVLIQHLRNRADGGPTIRNFVEALRTCERHDVARSICNWPWELEENRAGERQAC